MRVPAVLVAILCFALSAMSALANPTPIGSAGRNLRPFEIEKAPEISIAEEKLIVEDAVEGKIPSFSSSGDMLVPCVKYSASYRFDNSGKAAKKLKLGFPVVAYCHKCGGTSIGGIDSFAAKYDGKSLAVKREETPAPRLYPRDELNGIVDILLKAKLARALPETPEFIDLSPLGKSMAEARRAVKKAGLDKSKTGRIGKVLDEKVFGDFDMVVADQGLIWYSFNIELPAGLSKELTVDYTSFVPPWDEDYTISYILRTGQSWGGSVGKLEIEFRPEQQFLIAGGRYRIKPKGFTFSKKSSSYVLRKEKEKLTYNIEIKRIVPEGFKRNQSTNRGWGSVVSNPDH